MSREMSASICVVAFAFCSEFARAQDSDLLITADAGDAARLVTGSEDDATGELTLPVRVFSVRVEPLSGLDQLDGDRGYFGVGDAELLPTGYSPLQPLVDVRFDFRAVTIQAATSNFWYWDPVEQPGGVSFAPVADGRTFTFSKSPSDFFHATVDGAAADVAGFVIDRTGSAGQLHKHLTMVLNDADDDAGTPIRAGVYLVAYELSYSGARSELVYEVIDGNMEEGAEHVAAAVAYVNELLGGGCAGDLDGDEMVALSDLAILLSHFGLGGAAAADGDLDGDGDVDLADLAALLARFSAAC